MLYIMPVTELSVDIIPCQDVSLDPIKSTHLQLDDVPPELLPKHHECILKRVRVSACVSACVCMTVCVAVCMSVSVSVCVCTYTWACMCVAVGTCMSRVCEYNVVCYIVDPYLKVAIICSANFSGI